MQRVRLKVLTITAIVVATAVALVSVLALPAWGVWIGAAAAVALVVNAVANRLSSHVCLGCGHDLATESLGEFGVICPKCGSVNETRYFADLRSERHDTLPEHARDDDHTPKA
jgi:predicted RNA-binding Zn-ribbon protein involved in translation (DUF1610 family)